MNQLIHGTVHFGLTGTRKGISFRHNLLKFNRVVYLSLCGVTECVTGQRERLTYVPHHFTEISKGRLRRIENFVSGNSWVDPRAFKPDLAAREHICGVGNGLGAENAQIDRGEPPELA